MQAVISMRSRGRGAFALRKDLKAAQATICSLKRNKVNGYRASFALANVFNFIFVILNFRFHEMQIGMKFFMIDNTFLCHGV